MADLEGEYQEARMNGVREKHDICSRAPCKTVAHENETAFKRVRAELDPFQNPNSSIGLHKRYGEEGETNSPKRLKGVREKIIQIPGGHAYAPEELQYLVSDAELGKMSEALGKNWQLLGLSLKLETPEIEQCEESHPRSIQLQIYEMLLRWKKANLEGATMCALMETIIKQKASVSWNKVDGIINEHFSN